MGQAGEANYQINLDLPPESTALHLALTCITTAMAVMVLWVGDGHWDTKIESSVVARVFMRMERVPKVRFALICVTACVGEVNRCVWSVLGVVKLWPIGIIGGQVRNTIRRILQACW